MDLAPRVTKLPYDSARKDLPMDDDTDRDRVAEAIAGLTRGGTPVTAADREAALALAMDMLAAARRHGVTYEDFTWVGNLPAECLDVIRSKRDRG